MSWVVLRQLKVLDRIRHFVPTFWQSFVAFSQTRLGYVSLTAVIVVLVALALFEIGVLFGALAMILLAFGLPVYMGWNKSFKTLLIVALVVTASVPPIWAALSNDQLFTPYSPDGSPDGIIQHPTVTPFAYPPGKGNLYNFSAELHKQKVTTTGVNSTSYRIDITAVYLWVTDCPYDGTLNNHTVNNACNGGPDYLHEFAPFVVPKAEYADPVIPVWFNESLPSNNILYFDLIANYTLVNTTVYSYACMGDCVPYKGSYAPAADESYYWTEGPITGSWGYIYAVRILPTFYLIGAGLGAMLIGVVLVYRWLKIREKRRLLQAEDTAGGTPVGGETICPACGAVVKDQESFCWKCGKPLAEEKTEGPDVKAPLK